MGGNICHYCPFCHSFVGRTKPKFYHPKQTIDLAQHFFKDLEVELGNGLGQRFLEGWNKMCQQVQHLEHLGAYLLESFNPVLDNELGR